jgi:catechol 2,3-dioxygenase-like lactoylglutathione lyase family enzyme
MTHPRVLATALIGAVILVSSQGSGQRLMPPAHFHQVHLNTADSAKTIEFYTTVVQGERMNYLGRADQAPYIWSNQSWILLYRRPSPPWEPISGVWHMGFGVGDVKTEYERLLAAGTTFFAPPASTAEIGGSAPATSAFIDGPDHMPVELIAGAPRGFSHVHLLSENPEAAAAFYEKYFSARRISSAATAPRDAHGMAPSISLMVDEMNITITPAEYSRQKYPEYWKDRTTLAPQKGRIFDHIGFTYDDIELTDAIERLRKDGVKIVEEVRWCCGRTFQHVAFIEGPDQVGIELLEGRATRPQ